MSRFHLSAGIRLYDLHFYVRCLGSIYQRLLDFMIYISIRCLGWGKLCKYGRFYGNLIIKSLDVWVLLFLQRDDNVCDFLTFLGEKLTKSVALKRKSSLLTVQILCFGTKPLLSNRHNQNGSLFLKNGASSLYHFLCRTFSSFSCFH